MKPDSTKILNFVINLRHKRLTNQQFVLILSLVIGLLSGLSAVILKNLVHFTSSLITSGFRFEQTTWLYLALPFIGILLTLLFTRYLLKKDIRHGVSKILFAISQKGGKIEGHHTWSSMAGSTLTVAFGGSVGLEAPIVMTGSAIGSKVGQYFRMNHKSLIVLIGCGAAGAIAGIFKAPIAAVVFTIEVLMISLTLTSIVPLLIAAVTGASVAYMLSGERVLFSFLLTDRFVVSQIPWFLLLGIFTGLVSLYFTRTIFYVERQIKKIRSPFQKVIFGGSILGILIYVFPPLFGEGYEMLQAILGGKADDLVNEGLFSTLKGIPWFLIFISLLILFFKAIATSVTTGSGGVGGIFAPSLFMGGVAGFVFARIVNLVGHFQISEANFTLVGMAGVMSGVMHAPLTGIFLIAEITGGYQLLTPLIITATISYLTIKFFEPHSIYSKRLAERGELFTHDKDKAMLSLMKVENLLETNFQTLDVNGTLGDLVKAVPLSQRNIFPVIDTENNFYGVVFINDVRGIIFRTELWDTTLIRDLMFMPEPLVEASESMEEVAQKFSDSDHFNLPVLRKGKYLGFVSRAMVFSTYRKLQEEFSDE
jgi:CIC family chloride channel protein